MSLQLPKTIFFDMDDTILADSLMSEKCWEQVCERFSPRFGNISSDSLLATIRDIRRRNYGNRAQSQRGGPNLRNSRYEVVSVALSSLGLDDRQLAEEMTAEYMRLKSKLIEPFPNALDTLHKLSQSPVRLALITNGIAEEQRSKIEIAGLSPFFESILIEGEFGIGKPDQRVFQHMLAEMNVKPQENLDGWRQLSWRHRWRTGRWHIWSMG